MSSSRGTNRSVSRSTKALAWAVIVAWVVTALPAAAIPGRDREKVAELPPLGELAGASITVDSIADSVADDGACTLREAIISANTDTASGSTTGECIAGEGAPATDILGFDIAGDGPHTIAPTAALPAITGPTVLDGREETAIEVDGSRAGEADGIELAGDGLFLTGFHLTGFSGAGVRITGDDNQITGVTVGLDLDGATPAPNGVGIHISGGSENQVGGPESGARVVVSGNTGTGIRIEGSGSASNRIQGTLIGTDITGTQARGNGFFGIVITDAPMTIVGGGGPGEGNVISSNTHSGIVTDADGTVVQGNLIGLAADGSTPLGNTGVGVFRTGGEGLLIGGLGAGNVISGNEQYGVYVSYSPTEPANAEIQGNRIGTDARGIVEVPNVLAGVTIGDHNVSIGGTDLGEGNLVSGNGQAGIRVHQGVLNTRIVGNLIGTDANGTAAIANRFGVILDGADGLVRDNLISGNEMWGLDIAGPRNSVTGNMIGTDLTGRTAVANGSHGILVFADDDNRIGGRLPGEGNVISGNLGNGIEIRPQHATGNLIEGNLIGTDASGAGPLGNAGVGVKIWDSSENAIGGVEEGAGNVIAHNAAGVVVLGPDARWNRILGNAIHRNSGLAIDLGEDGVTPNDDVAVPYDADAGPNGLQNFPMIGSAVRNEDGSTSVRGTLASTPDTVFRLELFSAPSCAPQGYGGGATFIGAEEVATDQDGVGHLDRVISATVAVGRFITATGTDPEGNTSEFSACAEVQDAVVPPSPPGPAEPAAFGVTVALNLKKHLLARGKVRSFGPAACTERVIVKVQRRKRGRWKLAKRVVARGNGSFRARLRDRPGAYRAVVARRASVDVLCRRGRSPILRHRHRS